ncbi:hypothetical protein EVJ27_08225 [Exiguobacterium sp. SH3S2]|uniref:hypothetical protein n=1 Tax=unclassified Exiguobacterium TaxID=2644629 RepID=UPI001040C04E|nr:MULTISPECIES: hypothetical protein [unclassified Exiguobacterium]TCI44815.1 hypothetical protein EVJ28_08225 [Exiguobacterium sp. SH3S3]TCI60236.1 hypothetical protein EVJ27_08225 [Exiguobacterium sp. SH3S2]
MEEKQVIHQLRTAADDGRLTIHMYQQWQQANGGPTVLELLEVYGSWTNVLRLVGFENQMPRFTKSEMLRTLRRAAKDLGSISSADYRKWAHDHDAPTLTEVVIQFGSWKVALIEADLLGMMAKDQKIEIIQALLDASDEIEPFNSTTYAKWAKANQRPSITKVVRRFGSWTQALEEIGLSTRKAFTEQEILSALKEASEDLAVLSPWGYEIWQKKTGKDRRLKISNRCSVLLT